MHHQAVTPSLVLWRGRQWAVTSAGIETLDAPLHIVFRKERLGRVADDLSCFAAVAEALDQPWLDVTEFHAAWRQAMAWHRDSFAEIPQVWCDAIARRTSGVLRSRELRRQRGNAA